MTTKPVKLIMIGAGYSEIFGVICRFLPYRGKSCLFNSVNSGLTRPKFYTMQFPPPFLWQLIYNAFKFRFSDPEPGVPTNKNPRYAVDPCMIKMTKSYCCYRQLYLDSRDICMCTFSVILTTVKELIVRIFTHCVHVCLRTTPVCRHWRCSLARADEPPVNPTRRDTV